MSKYYEVKGAARRRVLDAYAAIEKARDDALGWADGHGCKTYVSVTTWGVTTVTGLVFPKGITPDPKVWKKYYNKQERRHEDWYVPNRSTKAGKAMAEELRAIDLPGASSLAEAIKLPTMIPGGFSFSYPGVRVWGPRKRVFFTINDKLTPKDEECTRISDLAFEKLEGRYEKKKKKRKKKKKPKV